MTTEFKSWEEMSTLEQYAITWSDMYKDAHGFRPRIDTSTWDVEDFEHEFKNLQEDIARNMHEEAHLALDCARRFEAEVTKMMRVSDCDRETALRRVFQQADLDINSSFDREHMEFKRGLPFGYLKNAA
jgi:predicted secreted Zn-dependent protease